MFQVQEFVAGKWFAIKSYQTEAEATEHSAKLPRSRVRKVTNVPRSSQASQD